MRPPQLRHGGIASATLASRSCVLAPSLAASFVYVFVFTLWTLYISLSNSSLLPSYGFVGLDNYVSLWANRRWNIAYTNLFLFSGFYVVGAMAVGLLLAILIDQRIRGEAVWRTIFLYPLAVSFIVTGTVWSWLYNPVAGIQSFVRSLGWTDFNFALTTDRNYAIYAIIITGIWQSSGFAMALFLAGLRSVDQDLIKAAQIDGAWRSAPTARSSCRRSRRSSSPSRSCSSSSPSRPSTSSAALTARRAGHLHHLPGHLRLRPDVPARPDRRGRGGGDHDARRARRGAGALLALCSSGAAAAEGGQWLTPPLDASRIDPEAAAAARRHFWTRVVIYGLLGALRAHLPRAAAGRGLQLVPRAARDRAERPHLAAAELPLRRLGRGLEHLLHRRHLRGHAAQLLQLALDDRPGDHHLDRARRHQRLHPVQMALPGLRDPLHLMLLGVFMPGQIALMPWAFILGKLGLANSIYGLVLIHVVQGISFTTLFCRNYYVSIPDDLIKAARIDGAGFWRIFRKIILPLSPPILIVTVIWQFTGIWNEYLFGVVFTSGPGAADHRGAGRALRRAAPTCAPTT